MSGRFPKAAVRLLESMYFRVGAAAGDFRIQWEAREEMADT